MERLRISQDIEKALICLKESPQDSEALKKLSETAGNAYNNGIDLVLKMEKSLLVKPVGTRPMDVESAATFSFESDEKFLSFWIPSNIEMRSMNDTDLNRLEVHENYRAFGQVVFIKNKKVGVVGTFLPNEIASIEVK